MLYVGRNVELKPAFTDFKNPSGTVEKNVFKDADGRDIQSFLVEDANLMMRGPKKRVISFLYLDIVDAQRDLHVGDHVTVGEIIGVYMLGKVHAHAHVRAKIKDEL